VVLCVMATCVVRVSATRPIPMRIFALAMRLETVQMVAEATPLLASLTQMREDVAALLKRYTLLEERIERTQNRILELVSDIQPVWDDAYNLCGDPACSGDCMVCRDGEYLGEEDYEEKYCRRGRR
jgi:hypothetical protein